LIAGDDIIFDTGRIDTTDGVRNHTVILTADNEGAADADRGSITNTAGAAATVTGSFLQANAFDGIGDGGNPLRTNITQLDATNSGSGLIDVAELATGTNLALGAVDNGTRGVTISAAAGSLTDANGAALNITAGTATLSATTGIGNGNALETTIDSLVATNSTSGNIVINETNGLIVGGTGVRTLAGNGNVDIDVDAGNLTINSVVTAHGSGSVTLNADNGTVALAATVSSTTGAIAATGDVINQNAGGNLNTGGAGTVTVTADNGDIFMDGAGTTSSTSVNGVIAYSATGSVHLSTLTSTGANITVTADSDTSGTGAITDNLGAETANLSTIGSATLSAAEGIGSGINAEINTAVGTLVATNTTSGDVRIAETNGLTVAGTGIRTLNGNGNVNVYVAAGDLAVQSVVTAHGSGSLTLSMETGIVTLAAAISSTSGAISVTGAAINQNAGGNISTGGAGNVIVGAASGSVTMANGTTTSSVNGTISYGATVNVALSQLISVTGNITVMGSIAITDNSAAESANLLTSGEATMEASQGIGVTGAGDIDTTIGTLVTLNSPTSGDIVIQETNGLIIGGTGVRTQGGNGNINIDVDAGNLTVNSVVTAHGSGTVTLNADAGTVTLAAAVSSTTGLIGITGDVINQNSGGDISTGGAGTITVAADNGSISMADGTTTTSVNGAIGYSTSSDIALSQVSSNNGAINLTADSDADNTGTITDNTAAETANLTTAATATLNAAQGIGDADDIETSLGQLAASNTTAGAIRITEVAAGGDLSINAVSNLTRHVAITIESGSLTDANGDTNNISSGPAVLIAAAGSIGSTSGDVFTGSFDPIEVNVSGSLTATASVVSGAVAFTGLVIGPTILTGATGYLEADGDLNVSVTPAGFANLFLLADADGDNNGTLTIANALTVTGDLRLEGADIVDGNGGALELNANRLGLRSDNNVTLTSNVRTMDIETLGSLNVTNTGALTLANLYGHARAILAAGGSIAAMSPLTISANVNTSASMSFTAGDSSAADDDLTINNNAVVTLNGTAADSTLTFTAGDDIIFGDGANSGSIDTTDGVRSHSVILAADNETAAVADGDRGSITNSAVVATATITTTLLQASASDGIGSSSGDAGTFDGVALRTAVTRFDATNADTSAITVTEVASGVDISIGAVSNGNRSVSITAAAGAITDANAAAVNVTAGTASLTATNGIGSADAIETTAATLNATSTTNNLIRINETDGVAVNIVNNGTRDVFLAAGGSITDANGGATNVSAGLLTIDATGSVDLDTSITSLDASTTAVGGIDINETDAITLTDIDTSDGAITVVAGGTITATDVQSLTDT
jgi:hypothetical protein